MTTVVCTGAATAEDAEGDGDLVERRLFAVIVPGVGMLAPCLRTGTLGRDPCAEAVAAYLSSKEVQKE